MREAQASDTRLGARLKLARDRARELGHGNEAATRNWHFYLLYNERHGVFGNRPGNAYAMSRRNWMESMLHIESKESKLIPFEFNQSQRILESVVLRYERRRKPVRIVILKVRQNGISTYELGFNAEMILRHTNRRVRVITDREDLCSIFRARIGVMLRNMRHAAHELSGPDEGVAWDLEPSIDNAGTLAFGEPFNSSLHFVSSNTPSPGFGETMSMVVMEETTKWNDPEEKAKGVLMTLPEIEGTVAIDVSQAKGNTGYFADKFKRAWNRQHGVASPLEYGEGVVSTGVGWHAVFFPWFIHDEYRWTRLGGNRGELPPQIALAIQQTLTDEERVLLKQEYLVHGRGLCRVDFDQLAWRRYCISEKCNGNLQMFHEQFPAFPDEAFLATGRCAFNLEHIQRARADALCDPLLTADVVEASA